MTSAESDGQLAGRRALITGSTSGIGWSTVRLFASEGATVIVSGRHAERGEQTVEAITSDGGTARFVPADLGHIDGVRRLAQEAGDVDVLVNNAALSVHASAVEPDTESFGLSFATNVRAPFFLVQELAPRMVARGSGSINQRLDLCRQHRRTWFVGVQRHEGGTEFAHADVGRGVRSGEGAGEHHRFWTRPHRKRDRSPGRGDGATGGSHHASRSPGRRDEIAEVALFLASDRASYLTGATIAVDAGRTAL